MKFELSPEEDAVLLAWITEHEVACKLPPTAIGGRWTFSFTPTGVGTVITVACACGKKHDGTKYSDW
jgi:hypothetical protein